MDTKEVCKQINNQHSDSPIIYRPKPKKLCISYNVLKSSHNRKKKGNKKQYPLTPVSNTNFNFKNDIKEIYKNKDELNLKPNQKSNLDFEKISLEEIENDFTKLKLRSEAYKEEKELLYLLRNSTKDNSVDEEFNKDIIKIKRPKNPFLENLQ